MMTQHLMLWTAHEDDVECAIELQGSSGLIQYTSPTLVKENETTCTANNQSGM